MLSAYEVGFMMFLIAPLVFAGAFAVTEIASEGLTLEVIGSTGER
jgi:hypothetical protein